MLVAEILAGPGDLRHLLVRKTFCGTWGLSVPCLCGKFSRDLETRLVAEILAGPGDLLGPGLWWEFLRSLGNLLGTHLKNLVAGILAVPGSLAARGGGD